MTNINNFFIFLCIASVSAVDLNKIWTVTCRSEFCKEGLETCISNNCFGARECKYIIDTFYPNCTLCANEILESSHYEFINGSYNLACDSGDDLHVKACLFYCRVNWYPYGECVRQNNNMRICRCLDEDTNIPIRTTTTTTTPSISTTTTATATANGMLV